MLPTLIIGAVGGVVVGMTSVGSGSLIIIALMAIYPGLRASELVGTDLVQAVPLVASAALAHILFGDFKLALTLSLLVGSVPGAFIGAQLSSRLPGALIRRALAFVLLASALKLFGTDNYVLLGVAGRRWPPSPGRSGWCCAVARASRAWPYSRPANPAREQESLPA